MQVSGSHAKDGICTQKTGRDEKFMGGGSAQAVMRQCKMLSESCYLHQKHVEAAAKFDKDHSDINDIIVNTRVYRSH